MFGLIYLLFNTVMAIGSGTRAAINNYNKVKWWTSEKEKGNNPRNIYVDRRGITRNLDTGNQVSFSHLYRTGDIIRKEENLVTNISDEWRKKYFQERRLYDKEHTVFPDIKIVHNHPNDIIKFEEHIWNNIWYAEGQWWRDYRTGNLYCIRELTGKYNNKNITIEAYMNVNTGLFERVSDDQLQKKIPIDICEEIISSYNSQKDRKTPSTILEWENFYLNYRIAKFSGCHYLREVLEKMKRDGCCPV